MHIRHTLVPGAALAFLVTAWPVAADCDPAGPPAAALPAAEVAFVGRAVDVDGPLVRFAVREVWAGDIGEVVEVQGSTRGIPRNQYGEDDRQWIEGATYLVIPVVDGPVLRDHICTATTAWTDALEALRPPTARILVLESAEPAAASPVPVSLIGVAAVVVVGLSVFAFGAKRR